jgi:guanylate kinase
MAEPQKNPARAPLFIVSGPSGSGKSTLIRRVLAVASCPLRLSVSATTRRPRRGETEGVDYYFWDRERFERELEADAFLEHALVHGNYYGTLRSEVEPHLVKGVGVILDIDVQGAAQIRSKIPDNVSVFIRAGTLQAYEERLRKRATESEQAIERRLANARRELAQADLYDFQVLNDDLEQAVRDVVAIVDKAFKGESHAG